MPKKASQLFLLPGALKDLEPIEKSHPAVLEKIERKIELLLEFPQLGTKMEGAYRGFFQLICGDYRIFYRLITETKIEIAYIRHGRRQGHLRIV